MDRTERNQRAMEVAAKIARKRFIGHPDREELIADSVSWAWQGSQTASETVTPANIAWFAVRRASSGDFRFEGAARSIAHSRHRDKVQFREVSDQFSNGLRDNPAEIVQVRLDYVGWLRTLSPRQKGVLLLMLAGWTTGELAKRFKLSPARITQFRRELIDSWVEFTNG